MAARDDRAVLQGWGDELLLLVTKEATSKQWTDWLRVPLEIALRKGEGDLVSRLLVAGSVARKDSSMPDNHTLLNTIADRRDGGQASGEGSTGRSCADTNSTSSADLPAKRQKHALRDAVAHGDAQDVHALLSAGASAKAKDRSGNTLLHLAVMRGDAPIVSELLRRGADSERPDCDGMSPLRLAVNAGDAGVVDALLEAGAGVNDHDGPNGMLGLMKSAAREEHVGILKALIAHGADVNVLDPDSYSAIHHVAMLGKVGAINSLAEVGADVALPNPVNGSTPLHWAARKGRCEAMVALLRHGAAADSQDELGRTALHKACAIKNGNAAPAVELLLIWGADETIPNNNGHTPEDCIRRKEGEEGPSQQEVELLQLLGSSREDRGWCRRALLAVLCKARLGQDGVGALMGRLVTMEEEQLFEQSWGERKGEPAVAFMCVCLEQ